MTKASIDEQVQQLKEIGAGGFEANQLVGIPGLSTVPGYDPLQHGFGTSAWTHAWTELFKTGKAMGMRVDQIYTPGWSAGIQGISPDEPGTAKELTFGSASLRAGETFSGAVPEDALPAGVSRRLLQGVIAYKCEDNCAGKDKDVPVLDPTSAVDLTSRVTNGELRYTAPPGTGSYLLVAAWAHGTGQIIELAHTATPSYMVDHFGASGARAIIDYWETTVLNTELRTALRASGGSFFFDSLELNRKDVEVHHWTEDFLQQFQRRRGYSLVPYLAAVSVSSHPAFELAGGVGERVREDYRKTLSELFVANHIDPIKQWAHKYGMTLRGQAYSSWGPSAIDTADAAIALDIPEQEANNRGDPLFATNESDAWREIVSANAQIGRTIVSDETGTFGRTDGLARVSLVARINEIVGLGMNQVIYHGWADQSPGAAAAWPGYYPFRNFVGDNYGAQSPTFADDTEINNHVARLQTILRRGELRDEVAIYWDGSGSARYPDLSLERSGYTYGFLNDTLVSLPSASLTAGRLTGLRYRALVLDASISPVPLSLAAARRILSWAESGFTVIVVGKMADRVAGYHPNDDAELQTVTSSLLAQRSVIKVADLAEVTNALRTAGIRPAASYDAQPLVTLHREDGKSNYFYFFNAAPSRTSTIVKLRGAGMPFRYDAWTGAIQPIATYTRTEDGVELTVDLATGDSELIALTNGNRDIPKSLCGLSVGSTSANEAFFRPDGTIALRDTKAGRYVTRLSEGDAVISTIDLVGVVQSPRSWTLDVTSWQAGATPSKTDKVPLPPIALTPATDGTLPDWQKIPGLLDKSGTSVYTTTIEVGRWTGGSGAYLNLGTFLGTAEVSVNDRRLPPLDQVDVSRIDLSGYLRPGRNKLQVHIATPIYNAGFKTKSPYGLVGPVTITPFGEITLQVRCDQR